VSGVAWRGKRRRIRSRILVIMRCGGSGTGPGASAASSLPRRRSISCCTGPS
jgi:hypothetical protein